MKQADKVINSVDEIKREIPITLDLIIDTNKIKRISKYLLHSTMTYVNSISLIEFAYLFNIKDIQTFKIILTNLVVKFPLQIK